MNIQQMLDNIRATYAKGLTIIEKKNADYAASSNPFRNFESATVVGISIERAILLRVLDKLARCSNLIDKPPVVVEESLEDTLIDAINYLAILKAYRERNKVFNMPEDVLQKAQALLAANPVPIYGVTKCDICGSNQHTTFFHNEANKIVL